MLALAPGAPGFRSAQDPAALGRVNPAGAEAHRVSHAADARRRVTIPAAVKRRLFNLLAALSGVMCVATMVLWVWSYHVADTLAYHGVDWGHLCDSTYFV